MLFEEHIKSANNVLFVEGSKSSTGEAYLLRLGAFGMFGHTASWKIYDLKMGVVREGTMTTEMQLGGSLMVERSMGGARGYVLSRENEATHSHGCMSKPHVIPMLCRVAANCVVFKAEPWRVYLLIKLKIFGKEQL